MPKSSPMQHGFHAGQLGPRLQGRTDLAKYYFGCNVLQNFIPTVQGPIIKRSGTRFVNETKDSSKVSRLIPFEFSREQAYMLEFGDLYMRVYRDGGVVLETAQAFTSNPTAANPVVITITGHLYLDGEEVYITGSAMTELNGKYFTVANKTANDFELSGENGIGRTTGAGGTAERVYEIATVYTAAQLAEVQPRQNADVLFLAHPDVPPQKIERTSDTAWTASEIAFTTPPFLAENVTDTTVYASAETGAAITVTASTAIFTADMVGSVFRIGELKESKYPKWEPTSDSDTWVVGPFNVGDKCYYEQHVYELVTKNATGTTGHDPPVHDDGTERDNNYDWLFVNKGFGWGEVTAVAGNGLSCTVDVDTAGVPFPESSVLIANATDKWSFGAWSDENGYPRAVAFYEDRLWWAGTDTSPQTFWGSRTSQYEDFEVVPDEADSGLLFTLATDRINAIEWMAGEDVLIIGTRGGEFTADSGSADSAITPDNIRVRRRSNYGTAKDVQPVMIDSALVFVQRSTKRVHDLVFDFDTDRYIAPDLTELAYDILDSGVLTLSYQASPFRQVWATLGNGSLASLVYVREQDVIGWATHVVGGTDVLVESLAVIPHPDEDEDQVWMLVSRTINGGTKRYIEYLEKPFEDTDVKEDAFFVDSGLTYTGASTTTLTGLDHLEGETVNVLGNGTVLNASVVSSGSITLDTAVTKAQVGLPLPAAKMQTMRIEAGMGQIGTAQGRRGRIHQVVIRLHQTGDGLFYGADFDRMDEWAVRGPDDAMDTPVPLFTGDTPSLDMPSGYEREKRLAISHSLPLPCTLVAVMPQLTTEPR